MVKRCPKCSSIDLSKYGNSFEKYMCNSCGYVGKVIFEEDEFIEDDEDNLIEEDDINEEDFESFE